MTEIVYWIMTIILIPIIIWASSVSAGVNTTFKTYSKVKSSKQIPAKLVAQKLLDNSGVSGIKIKKISGSLTDNYNPSTKTLNLSEPVFDSDSIAAIGVAAHEAGHAIQDAKGYFPLKLRKAIILATTIGSSMLVPLIVIGILLLAFSTFITLGNVFIYLGFGLYLISFIISLITLPVERNASKRALELLLPNGCLDSTEIKGAEAVLNAAGKTYVASLIVSLTYMLRFLFLILAIRDR